MGPAPICMFCVHLHRRADNLACDAFRGGIPREIIEGLTDHRLPVEGDNGIKWEQDPRRPTLPTALYDDLFVAGLPLNPPEEP